MQAGGRAQNLLNLCKAWLFFTFYVQSRCNWLQGSLPILGPRLFSSLLYVYLNEFKIKTGKRVDAPKDENMEHGDNESGSLDDASRK